MIVCQVRILYGVRSTRGRVERAPRVLIGPAKPLPNGSRMTFWRPGHGSTDALIVTFAGAG